jgi:hypothetical protein
MEIDPKLALQVRVSKMLGYGSDGLPERGLVDL